MVTVPALEVSNLVCRYAPRAASAAAGTRMAVIDGISFSIREGECLGLLGDSGSGKSTIARCVAGLAEPESGSISILGTPLYSSKAHGRRLTGKVQMLYQDHSASLNPMLTVRESLSEAVRARELRRASFLPALQMNRAVALSILTRILEQVGLAQEVLERFPRSLSGGERQRVALARSLAADPVLLVLDEPTSALDSSTQVQILELLGAVQKDHRTAVLFISHDIDAVAQLCSHIAVLYNGRLVEQGTAEHVLSNPAHPYTRRIVELHRRNAGQTD